MNDGKGVIAHSHLGKTELPQRLLPAAKELNTPEVAAARSSRVELAPLNHVEAAKIIRSRLGDDWQPTHFQWIAQRFPDGVPQDQVDRIVVDLSGPNAGQKQPLRVVAGGM